jgi:DnaD/phage-associated family protein
MANRRMIAGDMFEDDFIGELNYFERLLWIGLITSVADDQGRMMDNPALIRSRVFLFDPSVQDSEVERALNKINVHGKIVRYVSGNKALIQITKWWKYQTPSWASPSKYPSPTGWTDRAKYHSTGNKVITLNWDNVGGYVANCIPIVHRAIEEGDVKGDVKGEGEAETTQPPPNIFVLYQNEIGNVSAMVADELKLAEKEYPEDWIAEAIKEAVAHNARNWAYVSTILRTWKTKGRSNGHKKEPAPEVSRMIVVWEGGDEVIYQLTPGQPNVRLGLRSEIEAHQ